ncbi:hypothetical protein ACFWY9_24240 [Amycolatopsis sp. NPDC059027]|uniref:hypothetical protein n=1 Tax=Amycolatopsis sp. NPDC059027 TaxID=3346709 RepID=UPI00366FC180
MAGDDRAGQAVTLRGTAGNAHAGAVLVRDQEPPIYVDGLTDWGDLAGQEVVVTGVLVLRWLTPEPATQGVVSHGVSGAVRILHDAVWRRATTHD